MEGYLGILRVTRPPTYAKSGATTKKNINAHKEDSRIDDTYTRTTTSLVYQMLHRRTSGE
jgi:hypothetical protein